MNLALHQQHRLKKSRALHATSGGEDPAVSRPSDGGGRGGRPADLGPAVEGGKGMDTRPIGHHGVGGCRALLRHFQGWLTPPPPPNPQFSCDGSVGVAGGAGPKLTLCANRVFV